AMNVSLDAGAVERGRSCFEDARLLAARTCYVKARRRQRAQTFDVSSRPGAARSASSVSRRLNTRSLRGPDATGVGDAGVAATAGLPPASPASASCAKTPLM